MIRSNKGNPADTGDTRENKHKPLKIGLVGLGKIVVDQHIPAIRANPHIDLVAGCSPDAGLDGVRSYPNMTQMLQQHPEIEAVVICTPPQIRHAIALEAIQAGKHVFLEKPPAATLGKAMAMKEMAQAHGVSLLASWHSRFAPAVEAARHWIAQNHIKHIDIIWKENVRQWHPGQTWIFEAGGMGVFDTGINSLSILTHILNDKVIVKKANLYIPVNREAPIQVKMDMIADNTVSIHADYDFLQENRPPTWDMFIEAAQGDKLALYKSGTKLEINNQVILQEDETEYALLYAHFLNLVRSGRSDADFSPLRIVADAFMIGKRINAPAYIEHNLEPNRSEPNLQSVNPSQ